MLRDCLVVGVQEPHIQQLLLADGDLHWPKALEVPQAMVLAAKNAEELTPRAPSSTVLAPETTTASVHLARDRESTPSTCYRCG